MASRGVGGRTGRLSARANTAGGKTRGNALVSRASDCRFRSAFSSCHFDTLEPLAAAHDAAEPVKHSSLGQILRIQSSIRSFELYQCKCLSENILNLMNQL